MAPVPGGRRCDRCERVVHDLSAMTRGEASRFVAARADRRTCYRYLAREDGTLVFAPEPARAPLSAAVVAMSLAACTPWGPATRPQSVMPDDVSSALDDPHIVIPPGPFGELELVDEPRRDRLVEPDTGPEPVVDGATADVDPRPVAPPAPAPQPPTRAEPRVVEYVGWSEDS